MHIEKRFLQCAKHTGAWMSIQGTTVFGAVLATTEYRNFSALLTMLTPPFPPISKTNETVACKHFGASCSEIF